MKMYRMKYMAFVGVAVLVALAFWLLVSLCIPEFKYQPSEKQLYTIRHQEMRDNNSLYTDQLLQSIKDNNGYLVLGTSESGYISGGNYFDFLNADTTIVPRFSVIAGAGRTACTYFPLIRGNDKVENLKMIYFVNPAYWCNKLSRSNEDYFMRYTSYAAMWSAGVGGSKNVDDVISTNRRNVVMSDLAADFMSYYFDKLRRKYYQDLVFYFDTAKFEQNLVWVKSKDKFTCKIPASMPDSSKYNYKFNVDGSFDVNSYSLDAYPQERYRCVELRAMIEMCRERKVDITFVVGPYNRVAFEKANTSEGKEMQAVCDTILHIMKEENAKYIDATDISSVPGAFHDWQHHSSYGAFLIYQKIKDYVLEKENN